MSKDEVSELMRYQVSLILMKAPQHTYDDCIKMVSKTRSQIVYQLRSLNYNGNLRNAYNNKLNKPAQITKSEYLYARNNICPLCDRKILKYEDGSIDHIIPRSLGGNNSLKNLQFVHKHCNSIKSNKLNFKLKCTPLKI